MDQWVEATLDWEDARHTEQLDDDSRRRVHEADRVLGNGWPAEYVLWTFTEPESYRATWQGQANGTPGEDVV
ncbi:MAG: hypothetical protein ACE5LU_14230 [Anaerolineae bacterium]